jgi:vancomycin resistance protein YoaR
VLIAIPLVLILIGVAAWAADSSLNKDQALRRTNVAGQPVGGLTETEVAEVVDEAATEVEGAEIEIVTPSGSVTASAEQLGVTVDRQATVDAVMDQGRAEGLTTRAQHWVQSFFTEETVPLAVSASIASTETALAQLEGEDRTNPVEPSVAWDGTTFAITEGVPGRGIDAQDVVDHLPAAAAQGGSTLTVEAEPGDIDPRFSQADAEALADEAEQLTSQPLEVTIEGQTTTVPVETLRTWVKTVATDDSLELGIKTAVAKEDISALLPDLGQPAVNASFAVVYGNVAIDPGQRGTGCCAENTGQLVLAALQEGTPAALETTSTLPDFDESDARAMGITREIGRPDEFGPTTMHQCCESRVNNIHRMADLVRGYVIPPNGGQFNLNDVVGERTVENGFLEAGAIENGEHTTAVGGGVSQFATTTFNAAFFAGLDIPNYQFHTEYISRYPYGRESTVSYPAPDFIIENNTPYGVLMWPTYTDTSITMHLYSSPFASGEQTGQSTSSRGSCTDVVTTRTVTYVDGREPTTDQFSGYYRNSGPTC